MHPTVPLPYHANGAAVRAIDHGVTFTIARAESRKLTPEALAGTAQYLAHAANCHDDLVKALCDAHAVLVVAGLVHGGTFEEIKRAIARATAQ